MLVSSLLVIQGPVQTQLLQEAFLDDTPAHKQDFPLPLPVMSCPYSQNPLWSTPAPHAPELSVSTVTCGPGPQTSRPHGTRCRPQTGYKLQVRAIADRGQGAGSRPAGGPGPLPRSPLRCTSGPPLLPQHGPQTPPSGAPQRPGLGKESSVQRERMGRRLQEQIHTEIPVREGPGAGSEIV